MVFASRMLEKIMKRIAATALALACIVATPVWAALKPGDTAPIFTAQVALDGKDYSFSLAEA
jgi:peroxiredoxin Q/BCP